MISKRHILIVSYCYWPMTNPRAFRWTSLAEHWVALGHQVTVITSVQPDTEPEQTQNGVRIIRCGSSASAQARKAQEALNKENGNSLGKIGLRVLRYLYRNTLKPLQWPDYSAAWAKSAKAVAMKFVKQNAVDHLISVASPYGAHLVGLSVKSENPNINWLADTGDPFSLLAKVDGIKVNNQFLYSGRNLKSEQQVFNSANHLSVPSEGMRQLYLDKFKDLNNEIKYIPPLIRPSHLDKKSLPVQKGKISFFGTLYPQIRSPRPVLMFFQWLSQKYSDQPWELHFYGDSRECAQDFESMPANTQKKIFRHGLVSADRARELMHTSDYLVNIANHTNYALPSKTVEYVSTGRPVLNFSESFDDQSTWLFRQYPAAITLINRDWVSEKPSETGVDIVTKFMSEPVVVDSQWLNQWTKSYEVESVAQSYMNLLEGQ